MSYILKALRRAETERAKGKIPGLNSRHAPEIVDKRSIWPWLLVGAMAVNAGIIIFAIWPADMMSRSADSDFGLMNRSVSERPATPVPDWQRQDSVADAADQTQTNGNEVRPVPGQAQAALDPRLFAATDDAVPNPIPPVESEVAARLPPSSRNGAAAPVDWMSEPPSKPQREEPPPSLGLNSSDSLPLPQPKPLSVAARTLMEEDFRQAELAALAEEPLAFDEEFADEDEDLDDESLDSPVEVAGLAPDIEPEELDRPDAFADVPAFWQMSHAFRSQVPKIKLAVHVYAPENAGRFVIIDRRRYREGDEVAEGMLLESILPTGVVLDFQGQRFKLEPQ